MNLPPGAESLFIKQRLTQKQAPQDSLPKADVREYSGYRWKVSIQDKEIHATSDLFHQSDNDQPEVSGPAGVLAFLVRAASAEQDGDLKGKKDLEVCIADNPEVGLAFTRTLGKLRNNYEALYKMFHSLLVGKSATVVIRGLLVDKPASVIDQLIDSFIERVTELFDFSDVAAFMSSYEVSKEAISAEVFRLAGVSRGA